MAIRNISLRIMICGIRLSALASGSHSSSMCKILMTELCLGKLLKQFHSKPFHKVSGVESYHSWTLKDFSATLLIFQTSFSNFNYNPWAPTSANYREFRPRFALPEVSQKTPKFPRKLPAFKIIRNIVVIQYYYKSKLLIFYSKAYCFKA